MAQFLVLAYDGHDAGAGARRAACRAKHFEGIGPMVNKGEIRAAAALLDDAGHMIGSVVFTEFPSRKELDAWLERETYVREKVWQKIEVKPIRLAVLDGKVTP